MMETNRFYAYLYFSIMCSSKRKQSYVLNGLNILRMHHVLLEDEYAFATGLMTIYYVIHLIFNLDNFIRQK